jgi:hypothetical protein
MLYSIPHGIYEFSRSYCWPCNYGARSVICKAVKEYNLPLVFLGESNEEATQDMELFASHRIKRSRRKKLFNPRFYIYQYLKLRFKLEFPIPGDNPFNLISKDHYIELFDNSSFIIRLFDYIPWDRNIIKETITNECGWESPSGSISSWKIDCYFNRLTDYFYNSNTLATESEAL